MSGRSSDPPRGRDRDRDPETGEPLKPGHLSRRELRAHLDEMRRRWQAWAFGPRPDGRWTMTAIGWVRSGNGKSHRNRNGTDNENRK